ncbi:MAG: thioredoxin fold domain-containing protein [Desulfobacterales bacterium]|nr:thioredoxin fold domain-containing protein [Desulfobacterales bacterium]
MLKILAPIILLLLVLLLLPAAGYCQSGQNFDVLTAGIVEPEKEIRPGGRQEFTLKIELHDNWHINSNKPENPYLIPSQLKLAAGSRFRLEDVKYPKTVKYNFSFSDSPVSVYEGTFNISAVIDASKDAEKGVYELPLRFIYQPCRKDTCLAPESTKQVLSLKVTEGSQRSGRTATSAEAESGLDLRPGRQNGKGDFFRRMESYGVLLSLVLVFIGGLALNLTPCVYPIIPITISYFGVQSEGRTGRLFVLGLLYVAGISVTYSLIGVITALTGALFGGLLQHPAVILSIAVIFVLLSLSMFGFYEFKLPDSLVARAGGSRSGYFGALFMGLTLGIIAAPCIGPLVLGLVAYVAAKGDPLYGFFLFFFLSLGLGLPYLFLALFSGKIKRLPGSGQWMEGVKHIFGLVLLAMAVYFSAPLLPGDLASFALPVFGVLAALYLLFFDKTANHIYGFKLIKIIFCAMLISASVYGFVSKDRARADWPEFSVAAFERAVENNRKMVIVFYAEWCIPCRELKKHTLSDPRVIGKLREFKVFQVNLTRADDPETRRIQRRFEVRGVPTIILINSRGKNAERIVGMIEPRDFMEALSGVE